MLGTAAVSLAVPVPFVSNTKLKADDLNKDFAATEAITVNGVTYSRAAVFVKATTTKYYGNMHTSTSGSGPTGYVGAKGICEALLTPSKTAHMCTADELIRSAQLGKTLSSGWYATGVQDAQNNAQDCRSWTSADGSAQGYEGAFLFNGVPGAQPCGTVGPILCCD